MSANIFTPTIGFSNLLDLGTLYEQRIENDGDGNPLYVAYTIIPNAPVASPVWFIKKIIYVGGFPVRVQLPDEGIKFAYAYSLRATYFA